MMSPVSCACTISDPIPTSTAPTSVYPTNHRELMAWSTRDSAMFNRFARAFHRRIPIPNTRAMRCTNRVFPRAMAISGGVTGNTLAAS